MHLTYDIETAERLARSLGAFLDSNAVPVSPEVLRNAIAATQGHASWSAFADATKPEALDSQLQRWERAHILGSRGDHYGEELEMRVHTSYGLRYDASSEGPRYVRALDPLGREIGYWDCEEWREDPSSVMRQVLDSLLRGRSFQPRFATTGAPGTDQDGMVLLSSLDLVDVVQEAVRYRARAFEGGGEVRGAELVDWFCQWRAAAAMALRFFGLAKGDAGGPNFKVGDLVGAKTESSTKQAGPWRIKAVLAPRYHLDHPQDPMRNAEEGTLELVERADGSALRVELLDDVRLEQPVRLYVEVFACDEFGDAPSWARIILDRKLLKEVLRLRALVRTQGVLSLSILNDPDQWSSQVSDPGPGVLVAVQSCLNVTAERLWYSAEIKHASYEIQTQDIAFESLLPILSGQAIASSHIARYEDVIVVARESLGHLIERLLQDGESIPGQL